MGGRRTTLAGVEWYAPGPPARGLRARIRALAAAGVRRTPHGGDRGGRWRRDSDVLPTGGCRAPRNPASRRAPIDGVLAPSEVREAVILRYFSELSVPEIAAVMKKPEGTIKSRLSRALVRLNEILLKETVLDERG